MRRTLALGAVAVVLAATAAGDTAREIPIDRTVARVERLRDLSFERQPTAVWASQRVASEGVESAPPVADVVLRLLGVPSQGTTLEDGVLASYDPVEGRILMADDGPLDGPEFVGTMVHELTHALEDQHFSPFDRYEGLNADAILALDALVEGTAVSLEREYAARYAGVDPPRWDAGDAALSFGERDTGFVYDRGERFVSALRRFARGTWEDVNQALSSRPPRTTEQVLHPVKWLTDERAAQVPLPRTEFGSGWKREADDVWGEWRTGALVGEKLAAGWGGDRVELWRRGRQHALIMRWRWDTEAGARALAEGLLSRPFARDAGTRLWVDDSTVTLVIAPSGSIAARVR